MNTFFILTFIISLLGIAILIWKKISEIEKYANIEINPVEKMGMQAFFSENSFDKENIWDLSKINEIKIKVIDLAKEYGHRFILLILKIWIKVFYFCKIQKTYLYEKAEVLTQKLSKFIHGTSYPVSTENKILKQIINYKSRLIKIAKKLKEQEEKKHIE